MLEDARNATLSGVEASIDGDDVQAIMAGLFDANWKLDQILGYLFGDDDEAEEETDPT